MSNPEPSQNDLPGPGRVEAFSDGVLAIVITLLILEVKVPHLEFPADTNESLLALAHILPKLLGYLLSFVFVAVFWINHHRFFRLIGQVDNGLLWINNVLLLCLSFIPFPTGWIGEYPHNAVGLSLFSVVLMIAGLAFNWMWRYAHKRSLFHRTVGAPLIAQAKKLGLVGPAIYLLAAIFAFIRPEVTWFLFFVVPVIYAYPRKYK